MQVEFTLTETATSYSGEINEIEYEFEEFTVDQSSVGITNKKEKRSRIYTTHITREHYNKLTSAKADVLSFNDFVLVLRPFITGHYTSDELKRSFDILDRDHSGTIQIRELADFLPIINENATGQALEDFIKQSGLDYEETLSYDQFRSLILKGIGHEMICTHN